jgi:pimeloyl-ACP methyl ester carboxylesterase
LLPGLFAGAWIWQHTQAQLSLRGYRVITLSNPFALLIRSPTRNDTLISNLRAYLSEYFDQFKVDKAVLCANSLGALVAMDFTFHFPDRVEALVISGSPGLPSQTKPKMTVSRTVTVESAYAVANLLCYDRACLTDEMIETTFALLAHRGVLINIARALKAARDYDVRSILPHIDCPTLMIWGAHDRVTPVAEWQREIRLVKHGTLKLVEQYGHCPMLEQPNAFNAELLEFLSRRAEERVSGRVSREAAHEVCPGNDFDESGGRSKIPTERTLSLALDEPVETTYGNRLLQASLIDKDKEK